MEIISGTKGYVIEGRKLKIEKPKFPDHDGLYTCYVTNMFGKATQKATLTVTGKNELFFGILEPTLTAHFVKLGLTLIFRSFFFLNY